MVKKITRRTKFEASDGREFDTTEEAEKHERITDATREFERARTVLGQLLAETQRTADGERFTFRWAEYWFVRNGFGGFPDIFPVRFERYNFDFDDADQFVIIIYDPDGKARRFPVNALYCRKANADKALVVAQEERIELFRQQLDETKARIKPDDTEG